MYVFLEKKFAFLRDFLLKNTSYAMLLSGVAAVHGTLVSHLVTRIFLINTNLSACVLTKKIKVSNEKHHGIPPDSIAKHFYFYIIILISYPTSMTGIIVLLKIFLQERKLKLKYKHPKKPIHQLMMAKLMNLSNCIIQ